MFQENHSFERQFFYKHSNKYFLKLTLKTGLIVVRPQIGNREKHQRKQEKHQKKLGKQWVKHEETYGEMGETYTKLSLETRGTSEPLIHQFSSRFIHCRIHLRMTTEYVLWTNQYIAVHFFDRFLLQMVSYALFILIVVGGESRSTTLVLSFNGRWAAPT